MVCCAEVIRNNGDRGLAGMLPTPLYFPNPSSSLRRRSRIRRNSRRPKPEYERNIVSAFFALASAVLLAIAEAEPKWLHIVTGKCEGKYIGLYKVILYKHPETLGKVCDSVNVFSIEKKLSDYLPATK